MRPLFQKEKGKFFASNLKRVARSSNEVLLERHHRCQAVLKRSDPRAKRSALQAYLVFFGQHDGLCEGRDIQAIDHVFLPDRFETALNAFLSGRCPLQALFKVVDRLGGGKKISRDHDTSDTPT